MGPTKPGQLMETNRIRNLPICIEEVDMGALVDKCTAR